MKYILLCLAFSFGAAAQAETCTAQCGVMYDDVLATLRYPEYKIGGSGAIEDFEAYCPTLG